jgi:aspartate racemase
MTMRTLGILGGMSWESTAVYYRLINQGVAQRLGGLHSAALVLHSVDFAAISALQSAGQWQQAGQLLASAAAGLRAAGAEALVLATNTMHKVADQIEVGGGLPLLHIADATAAALRAASVQQVLLLGTRYTMEDPCILVNRLQRQHAAVQVQVPDDEGRTLLQRVIFDELCRGIVNPASRAAVLALISRHQAQGAQAVILGCTELMLLVDERTSPLPSFDSTALHAAAAVQWMLGDCTAHPSPETAP